MASELHLMKIHCAKAPANDYSNLTVTFVQTHSSNGLGSRREISIYSQEILTCCHREVTAQASSGIGPAKQEARNQLSDRSPSLLEETASLEGTALGSPTLLSEIVSGLAIWSVRVILANRMCRHDDSCCPFV
jgi:hypothetical protein